MPGHITKGTMHCKTSTTPHMKAGRQCPDQMQTRRQTPSHRKRLISAQRYRASFKRKHHKTNYVIWYCHRGKIEEQCMLMYEAKHPGTQKRLAVTRTSTKTHPCTSHRPSVRQKMTTRGTMASRGQIVTAPCPLCWHTCWENLRYTHLALSQ